MHFQAQKIAGGVAALFALADSTPVQLFSPNPKRDILKRSVTKTKCGIWPSADLMDNTRNYENLRDKPDVVVKVDGGSCSRIGCYTTSGMYVCNDNSEPIELDMDEVMDHFSYLMRICIGADSYGIDQVSGQSFSDGGWNVNIGYCNGKQSTAKKPHEYGGWPGPDGEPDRLCGWGDYPPCDIAGACEEGSIVINEQQTENCPNEEYLGGNYVHAGANSVYSFSRATTEGWVVGGNIGLSVGNLQQASGQAGFTAAYTSATSEGYIVGVSAPCGPDASGDYTCGLIVRPQCEHIRGSCKHYTGVQVPFEIYAPLAADDNISVVDYEACTCGSCSDAENPDAPETCPLDCDTSCP